MHYEDLTPTLLCHGWDFKVEKGHWSYEDLSEYMIARLETNGSSNGEFRVHPDYRRPLLRNPHADVLMKQKFEEALQLSGAVQGHNTALGSTRQIRLATDARYAEPAFRTPLTDEELYKLADAIREIRKKTP